MIIEQIRLSNWLSYPDKWHVNGQDEIPSLRFDSDPVCLIFGKNGAGKSSIMEAVLFALFGDYARASDRQDIKQATAIRTGEKSASVELVFSLNGQRHKIQRGLNERGSTARYFYWNTEQSEWVPDSSSVREINNRVVSLIGMGRDLFCGTVILEQGKAGHFMELKPGDQVDHVVTLLGLNVYIAYHEQAKKLANRRKQRAKEIEEILGGLRDVSAETVSQAEGQVVRLKSALKQMEVDIQRLDNLHREALAVQQLRTQIAQADQQIAEHEAKLAQKDEIINAAQVIREWERVEPQLREVKLATDSYEVVQNRLNGLQDELQQIEDDIQRWQESIADLMPRHIAVQESLETARADQQSLREELAEAQEQRNLIAAELRVDQRERQLLEKQAERQERLEEIPSAQANFQLWTELHHVEARLKAIVERLNDCTETLSALEKQEQELDESRTRLEARQEQWTHLNGRLAILEAEVAEAKQNTAQLDSQLQADETLLSKREEAHDQAQCPTCGTRLEDKELDRFHQELLELRQRVEARQKLLHAARRKADELSNSLQTLTSQRRQEETAIEREDSRLDTARESLEESRARVIRRQQEARQQWQTLKQELNYSASIITVPTEVCLNLARERLKAVSNAPSLYQNLKQIEADFNAAASEIGHIQGQRKYPLDTFSEAQLEQADETVRDLKSAVAQAEASCTELATRERALHDQLARAQHHLQTLEQRARQIKQELLPNEAAALSRSRAHLQGVTGSFKEHLSTLSWPASMLELLGKSADGDDGAEQGIREWVELLQPLATQLITLQEAEKVIDGLRTRRATWEEEVENKFSQEARSVGPEEVQYQLASRRDDQEKESDAFERSQKLAWEEARRLEQKCEQQEEHQRLIKEERNFRDLADLLAPPGRNSAGGPLLRQIMRKALQQVAFTASNILDEWGQSTEVIIPEDTLEFKVIDRSSASSERHYQLFSGGEKFMVALAMALAIGETASATGHTDCLFIDEGFGLLDAENRARVAQEIVSNLVGSGRRKQVIVITHMEDLQSAFAARYHLVNEGNATVLGRESANVTA